MGVPDSTVEGLADAVEGCRDSDLRWVISGRSEPGDDLLSESLLQSFLLAEGSV
jgi:hypothetical protein